MPFNDSDAAELGQGSGEVRAICMFLGLAAASTLLPLSWEPPLQLQASDVAACGRRAVPWQCPAPALPSEQPGGRTDSLAAAYASQHGTGAAGQGAPSSSLASCSVCLLRE